MIRIVFAFAVLLAASAAAFAQTPRLQLLGLAGPVVVPESGFTRWNGSFVFVGGGTEFRSRGRFGFEIDGGLLTPVTNPNAINTGLVSPTIAYHFRSAAKPVKVDPFIDTGVTVLFGGGGSGGALHYGGGLNYWLKEHFALRAEYRGHTWPAEVGSSVQLNAFRFGVVFGH